MIFDRKWQDRLDAFYEERLSFQSDQIKLLREVYEAKANVQDEKIKMLEGRIENLDGWIQTVATTKGIGVPHESNIGEYEEDLAALDFDPEDDMTLFGMIEPFDNELQEEEAEEVVTDAN